MNEKHNWLQYILLMLYMKIKSFLVLLLFVIFMEQNVWIVMMMMIMAQNDTDNILCVSVIVSCNKRYTNNV